MNEYSLISSFQYGFIPGKSSSSELLTVLNKVMCSFDKKIDVDIIYFDITKAFDSVSHVKLLSVLQSYGICCNVFKWIKNFLNYRKQKVRLRNSVSSSQSVLSGVPQGSVLGPLLFVMYINDLVEAITDAESCNDSCAFFLYADDAKIIGHNVTDVQNAISHQSAWMDVRQLSLAPTKFQHLSIQRHAVQKYAVSSVEIHSSNAVKNLGVFICNDLKWNKHVSYLQSKAYATAFQILKTFVSKNFWTLFNAYIIFVRPQLEFNTPVWSPHLQKDIFLIESVQKRFTRSICLRGNIPFSCYADRLNKLNIKSLQYRRLEFDLILTFKICYGLVDIAFNDFFEYCDTGYDLRRHRLALRPLCRPKHKPFKIFSIIVLYLCGMISLRL